MSKSNEDILNEFNCALNNIRVHLNRNKDSKSLDDLREVLGMNRKNKKREADNE